MKICVLGNSHVACLSKGWDKLKYNHKNVQLTFFAHRGEKLSGLTIKHGRLSADNQRLRRVISHTSGGREHVDPNEFDCFLIFALGAKPYRYRPIYYSQQVHIAALEDHATHSTSWKLIERLRQITDKPIYVGHNPLHAASPRCDHRGGADEYYRGIAELNEYIYEPQNTLLLCQPEQTITDGFETKHEYSIGSTRLDTGDKISNEPHEEKDRTHMNAQFGELYLSDFLTMLASEPELPVSQKTNHKR